MRIDLVNSPHRPWYIALGLRIAKKRIGVFPGPPLTMSYKPVFFHRDFMSYAFRGMAGSGGWTKGEAELFASFVSNLNACHF